MFVLLFFWCHSVNPLKNHAHDVSRQCLSGSALISATLRQRESDWCFITSSPHIHLYILWHVDDCWIGPTICGSIVTCADFSLVSLPCHQSLLLFIRWKRTAAIRPISGTGTHRHQHTRAFFSYKSVLFCHVSTIWFEIQTSAGVFLYHWSLLVAGYKNLGFYLFVRVCRTFVPIKTLQRKYTVNTVDRSSLLSTFHNTAVFMLINKP